MEIKAFELLNLYESLNKLSEQELDLETSYTIAKYMKEIFVAKDLIDGKRNKIILKYAKKQEDGNLKQTADGNIEINEDYNPAKVPPAINRNYTGGITCIS